MSEKIDYYRCARCRHEWTFFPEDYESKWDWPTICPHCTMSVISVMRETMPHDIRRTVDVLIGKMRRIDAKTPPKETK